jgi:uncharacterized protein YndB with AHSA1/START domain
MKLLKRLAIAVAIVIVVPLVVATILPRTFVLEREVVIDRPTDQVFDYVRQMGNQKHYSVWARIDPGIKTRVEGLDGGVGAIYSWESSDQNVGVGEQEITAIREGERIDFQIRVTQPFQSADPAYTTTESVGNNQTKVRTVYHGKLSYPSNLLCTIVCSKVGDDMQGSLLKLKEVLEHPANDEGVAP